jgi:hypothetical protein
MDKIKYTLITSSATLGTIAFIMTPTILGGFAAGFFIAAFILATYKIIKGQRA